MGIALWPQQTTWPQMMEYAELVDELGFEHIWTVDHWLAPHGDPDQSCFDGWAVLSGWATRTRNAKLSLFVGANTFRSPTAAAKLATTLDHQSGGRAMLGLGAGWFEREHEAYGVEFGRSPGERIGWLDESAGIARRLLDGESVTVAEGRYRANDLRLLPRPIQEHLPMVIGGSGEKKTLRVVAKHADVWNAFGSPAFFEHKIAILGEHCAAVGRDIADIELTLGAMPVIRDNRADAERVHQARLDANRITPANSIIGQDGVWLGTVDDVVARIQPYRELGVTSVIVEMPAPYDEETIRRLATEVMPRLRD
jgi:alkanesulfonate monooxygenase SsuD/methylene tetrahydromethanopterin reductase-like flavin-dependent oxidoreductase (luciferase family)